MQWVWLTYKIMQWVFFHSLEVKNSKQECLKRIAQLLDAPIPEGFLRSLLLHHLWRILSFGFMWRIFYHLTVFAVYAQASLMVSTALLMALPRVGAPWSESPAHVLSSQLRKGSERKWLAIRRPSSANAGSSALFLPSLSWIPWVTLLGSFSPSEHVQLWGLARAQASEPLYLRKIHSCSGADMCCHT